MKKTIIILLCVLLLFSGCAADKKKKSSEEQESAMININTVKTASFTMNYLKFGNGKKIFVILPGLSVQSVMGFADSVAEAYQIFADDYTVYLFDRRNELPEKYTVYDMAQDTAEAFKVLGLDHVDLFGASQGGMIAMEIAIKYPELVNKLVLGSTSASIEEDQYQTVGEWVWLAEDGDREGLYLAFGEAIYPQDVFEQSKGLLIEAAKTVTDEDLERFIILAEGMKGFDVADDLGRITCPVLVIGSEDDQVLGAEASVQIAERLGDNTDAVLYMYDGYGHAVYDLAPDYKDRMLDFFES